MASTNKHAPSHVEHLHDVNVSDARDFSSVTTPAAYGYASFNAVERFDKFLRSKAIWHRYQEWRRERPLLNVLVRFVLLSLFSKAAWGCAMYAYRHRESLGYTARTWALTPPVNATHVPLIELWDDSMRDEPEYAKTSTDIVRNMHACVSALDGKYWRDLLWIRDASGKLIHMGNVEMQQPNHDKSKEVVRAFRTIICETFMLNASVEVRGTFLNHVHVRYRDVLTARDVIGKFTHKQARCIQMHMAMRDGTIACPSASA